MPYSLIFSLKKPQRIYKKFMSLVIDANQNPFDLKT